ncbi:hypothetical protein ACLX1H_000796 [Fusarium chlamydosporum]
MKLSAVALLALTSAIAAAPAAEPGRDVDHRDYGKPSKGGNHWDDNGRKHGGYDKGHRPDYGHGRKPDHGRKPWDDDDEDDRKHGGHGKGGRPDYGRKPDHGRKPWDNDHGRKPDHGRPDYGKDHGRKPWDNDHGRKPDHGRPDYGKDHGRKPDYGRKPWDNSYSQGGGRGGKPWDNDYKHGGHGGKPWDNDYKHGGHGGKPDHNKPKPYNPWEHKPGHGKPKPHNPWEHKPDHGKPKPHNPWEDKPDYEKPKPGKPHGHGKPGPYKPGHGKPDGHGKPGPYKPGHGKPDGHDKPDGPYKPGPSKPDDHGKPDGPYKPGPSKPDDHGKPDGPYKPGPSKPDDHGKPDGPYKPGPSKPDDHGKPDGPYKPGPSKPDDHGKPDGPYKPGPSKPDDHGKPDGPYKPGPSKPDDHGKPDGPYKPGPSKPDDHGKPDGPYKPGPVQQSRDEKGWPGWQFPSSPDTLYQGATEDHIFNSKYLHEVYFKDDPSYTGRYSVPVLWDKKENRIVNNESHELLRWLPTAFDSILDADSRCKELNLYPEGLRSTIDEVNVWMQRDLNSGVYKAGFATTQEDYNNNVPTVFAALNKLEQLIYQNGGPYVLGKDLTEVDIRAYTTIVRFDIVYVDHFKCNLGTIRANYPVIHEWLKNLYWNVEGFKETTDFRHIKENYTKSHHTINPLAITPLGPFPDVEDGVELDFSDLQPGSIRHPAVLARQNELYGMSK